ncbi:MAG: hypothetical protein V2A77_03625 [Pseudomonadota bacterium]
MDRLLKNAQQATTTRNSEEGAVYNKYGGTDEGPERNATDGLLSVAPQHPAFRRQFHHYGPFLSPFSTDLLHCAPEI